MGAKDEPNQTDEENLDSESRPVKCTETHTEMPQGFDGMHKTILFLFYVK